MNRQPIIIDTNVIIAANNTNNEWAALALACVNRLVEIEKSGIVCLDQNYLIWNEYSRNLGSSRKAYGDAFFMHIARNLKNEKICSMVKITPTPEDPKRFAEFPDIAQDPANPIDEADRKFIAVSNAHPQKPPIVQATDSKWIGWEDRLKQVGIEVQFIDRDWLTQKYTKKIPASGV